MFPHQSSKDYFRLSHERALARLVPGKLQDLSELWKEEWGKIYPGMDASCWKQVLNRYKYHFGEAEQKYVFIKKKILQIT